MTPRRALKNEEEREKEICLIKKGGKSFAPAHTVVSRILVLKKKLFSPPLFSAKLLVVKTATKKYFSPSSCKMKL